MFEIKCLVTDKNLTRVLVAIHGYTIEAPLATPVREGVITKTNGAMHPVGKPSTNPPAGNTAFDILRSFVKGKKTVKSGQVKEHLMEKGYSGTGYSYALSKLVESGALKKAKTPRTYEVTGK